MLFVLWAASGLGMMALRIEPDGDGLHTAVVLTARW
jgi:hypothetical protein